MKVPSIQYTRQGDIELVDVSVGSPGPGEVQVEGVACGVCAWDIATCKLGEDMPTPAPPGHEGMGYVVKTGPGVKKLKVGDRVAGGGFAKLSNLSEAEAYVIPDTNVPDPEFLAEPVSCIITGLDTAKIRPGDSVAVLGCGFMGLLLIQALLKHPIESLTVLDINQSRLDLVRSFGVSDARNLAEKGDGELPASLEENHYNIVIDTTGSQQALDLATKIVCPGGQINLFGWIKGTNAHFDPTAWHIKGISVINSSPSAAIRNPFPPAIRAIASGLVDLKPLITHTVSLKEYPELMREILAGEKSYIKGVVTL